MSKSQPLPADLEAWLLDGDPAVVWQVQRDLLGAPAAVWAPIQQRIAHEGWGARLLAERDEAGTWSGGLYGPKWVSTFYTLRQLYWFGLDGSWPEAVCSCALLLDEGFCPDGALRPWNGPNTDCCVNAMMVAMAMHFGHERDERADALVGWLLSAQLGDGGWNCQHEHSGCRVSSFHTTLSVLEALADYGATNEERAGRIAKAAARGRAYFLRHHIYRSERTGNVVKSSFTRFSFPPRWYFDVLRALDHFRVADPPWDRRLDDAIDVVRTRATSDGRWKLQNHHTGPEFFRLEQVGAPSRWNTLRALRVLAWADATRSAHR